MRRLKVIKYLKSLHFSQDAGLSFSGLPDEMLNEVCSFLPFKDRRSLTETAKQFSPLEKGPIQTQSLGTTILQQLATDEAIDVANMIPSNHLKSLALSKISKTLLENGNIDQAIEVARTTSL